MILVCRGEYIKINKYVYNENKKALELLSEDEEYPDTFDFHFGDEEDGYDDKTGEYYWIDMSYYRLPQKTNHFIFEEREDEEAPLY